jgi:hypothetical protein
MVTLVSSMDRCISLSGRGILDVSSISLSEAANHKKNLKQFLYTYVQWAIPATLTMAKKALKLIGTYNWLTPWRCPMSDPSSTQLQQYTTSLILLYTHCHRCQCSCRRPLRHCRHCHRCCCHCRHHRCRHHPRHHRHCCRHC